MTESVLSNDELELLAGLEENTANSQPTKKKPGRKKTSDLDEDSASFALLKDLCAEVTATVQSAYGESGCEGFEVMRPSLLPYVDGSGHENLLGTEELTFVKFAPTRHKGGIYAIFALSEPRPNVAIWLEDLPEVLGDRGKKLMWFIDGPTINITQRRAAIIDQASAVDHAAEYEGNNEYGAW